MVRLNLSLLKIIYPAGREWFPWHDAFQNAKARILSNLFSTHEIIKEIQKLWFEA